MLHNPYAQKDNENKNDFTVDFLRDNIRKRIGLEQFQAKIEFISQHDLFSKTLRKTATSANVLFKNIKNSLNNSELAKKNPSEKNVLFDHFLLFDYEFARLFKSNEIAILNLISSPPSNETVQNKKDMTTSSNDYEENKDHLQNDNFYYKQIISQQDLKLNEQLSLNQSLQHNLSQMHDYCNKLFTELNSLKQQQYEQSNFKVDNDLEKSNTELKARCQYLEEKYIFILQL